MKARLPKGYGPKGMNDMLKQAQAMQNEMELVKSELDKKEYTSSSGGGVVRTTVLGDKTVTGIKIEPEVVDPEDIEMLEDLIIASINDAMRMVDEDSEKTMEGITSKYNLGGIL
jgi:DNA-binding YbaB/EbfC family protein